MFNFMYIRVKKTDIMKKYFHIQIVSNFVAALR